MERWFLRNILADRPKRMIPIWLLVIRAPRCALVICSFVLLLLLSTGCEDNAPPLVSEPSPQDSILGLAQPFWLIDGRIAGLSSAVEDSGYGVYVVDSSGGPAEPLMTDSFEKNRAILSPDGSRIAYLAAEPGRLFCCAHVWVVNVDGSNKQDLTPFGGNWENLRWSPESKKVIFDGGVEDSGIVNYRIITADVETGEITQLTKDNYGNRDASYSFDGTKVFFTSGRIQTDYGGKVWCMNSDGSDPMPLDSTKTASAYGRPSPASDEVAFFWGFGGESDAGVYSINLDTLTIPVSSLNFRYVYAGDSFSLSQLSPDGQRVLFASGSPYADLYVIELDGSNIQRLTTGLSVALFSYAWFGDSRLLVFNASDDLNKTNAVFTYDLVTHRLKKLSISR